VSRQGDAEYEEHPRVHRRRSNVPESATFTIIVVFLLHTRSTFLIVLFCVAQLQIHKPFSILFCHTMITGSKDHDNQDKFTIACLYRQTISAGLYRMSVKASEV
jgi:hypothetical protein